MKVRFFLATNMHVEWIVPDEQHATFNLPGLVNNIRAAGFFLAPNLYIPQECIVSIGFEVGDNPMPFSTSSVPPGRMMQ